MPPANTDQPGKFKIMFRKNNNEEGKGGDAGPAEVMWPRDVLVPFFKDARVATYSYESDWRDPDVKTSLYQYGEQFLNVLSQHRQGTDVSAYNIFEQLISALNHAMAYDVYFNRNDTDQLC